MKSLPDMWAEILDRLRASVTASLLASAIVTPTPAPEAIPAPETSRSPHFSTAELEPIQKALRGFKNATVYTVGRSETPVILGHFPPDSKGTVAGYPIRASALVSRQSWFDSLRVILVDPETYDRRDRLCIIQGPDHVARLRGARDSLTVMTSLNCTHLSVMTGSGYFVSGWLDDEDASEVGILMRRVLSHEEARTNSKERDR